MYNNEAWRKYRFRFLAKNPNCYVCGAKATVVDHIIPHKGDTGLFESLTNHMPLCSVDHNTITGKFDMHKLPKIDDKLAWINKRREENKIFIKIKPLSSYQKG